MKNAVKQTWKRLGITGQIFLVCFFVYFTCYTAK